MLRLALIILKALNREGLSVVNVSNPSRAVIIIAQMTGRRFCIVITEDG